MKVEIYTTKKKRVFPQKRFPDFTQENYNKWTAIQSYREAKKTVKRAESIGLDARCFDEKYDRSTNYRQMFIKANPAEKYRCVYCGKLVSKDRMTVDHVIPVALAKKSKKYQKKLKTKNGVNDLSNLVPSCWKCNKKKGASASKWWRLKATVGRYNAYWAMRLILILVLVLILIVIVAKSKYANMPFSEFVETVKIDLCGLYVSVTYWFKGILSH